MGWRVVALDVEIDASGSPPDFRQQRTELRSSVWQSGLLENVTHLGFGTAPMPGCTNPKRTMHLIRQVSNGNDGHAPILQNAFNAFILAFCSHSAPRDAITLAPPPHPSHSANWPSFRAPQAFAPSATFVNTSLTNENKNASHLTKNYIECRLKTNRNNSRRRAHFRIAAPPGPHREVEAHHEIPSGRAEAR